MRARYLKREAKKGVMMTTLKKTHDATIDELVNFGQRPDIQRKVTELFYLRLQQVTSAPLRQFQHFIAQKTCLLTHGHLSYMIKKNITINQVKCLVRFAA
ncbi:MAG: hypothetical protein WBP13_12510 [Methylophilaceae bacterium]